MSVYHMKQVVGDQPANNIATSYGDEPTIEITSFPFPEEQTIQRYQQVVAQLTNNQKLMSSKSYLVKVSIEPNDYYNINYGIRLINYPNESQDLRDYNDYQLIKYITIPKYSIDNPQVNRIWLYRKTSTDKVQNAAIAQPLTELPDASTVDAATQRANKIYYTKDNNNEITDIQYYDHNGVIVDNYLNKDTITYTEYVIPGVDNNQNEKTPTTREFIITPEDNNYDTIFFYMEPIIEDTNLWWYDGDELMYGRHIDITKMKIDIYELTDILSVNHIDISQNTITNIGVWGRSEQLMALNGQEIKIGPSGYYELELNNYILKTLCIANIANGDKYTVDIQYKINE